MQPFHAGSDRLRWTAEIFDPEWFRAGGAAKRLSDTTRWNPNGIPSSSPRLPRLRGYLGFSATPNRQPHRG